MLEIFLVCASVILISQLLGRFARSIRASVSDTSGGKAIHIQTPVAVFDVKPQGKVDPELAAILVYPGATPIESQPAEYEADIRALGREYRILVASYWTLTSADAVWEFYKRELQGWQEKRQRGYGRSLSQDGADGVRSVRVYTQNGGTLIETKFASRLKTGAAATGSSSDTRYGILR